MLKADVGRRAVADLAMARDCAGHARMFFNRADLDLATAVPGSFALLPHDDMLDQLRRDYTAMQVMIFGGVPPFDTVMESVAELEAAVNGEGRA